MNWLLRCVSLLRTVQHPQQYLQKARNAVGSFKSSIQTIQTMVFRETWTRAQAGDPKAQLHLGERYYDGQGVPQDYTEALQWFRKAAEQGNEDAQVNAGTLLILGRGAERDAIEGYKWIHLAALRKHPGAVRAEEKIRPRMKAEQIAEARKRARAWLDGRRARLGSG